LLDVSVVMFAIQGGVRLYTAVRRADADAKRMAGLVLPLPLADDPGVAAALVWFAKSAEGRPWLSADAEIGRIVGLARPATPDEERWLVERYRTVRPLAPEMSAGEAMALLTVQQWAQNESGAPRSPLQTVAGEVVNIAVDYFADMPGAVSEKRPEGKALKSALEALSETDFGTADLGDAAGQIVLAVVGAVSKNPEVVGGGDKERILVKSVASALATSAADHLGPNVPTEARLQAGGWLRLVGAAVLEGGIDAVSSNPDLFLGDDDDPTKTDPKKTVLFDVAKSVADLLVGDDKSLTFRGLLAADGLRVVVRAAVDAVARNPAILGKDRRGLRTILLAVATDLVDRDGLPTDLGPELARVVLEKTAANLDLVWPAAARSDAGAHLLLVAAKSVLSQLATPADGAWRPQFGKAELVALVDVVLDEVVDKPDWLVGPAGGKNDDLGAAVGATLRALAAIPGSRVNGAAAASAIESAVVAVADNHDLLDKLPAGSAQAGKSALEAAVGAVVSEVFRADASAKAKWSLARTSVVLSMSRIALAELAKHGVTPQSIEALRAFVAGEVNAARAFDADSFAAGLAAALAA
jgi:hypothetical protein